MHANTVLVVDKAELAKAVHEETDAGPGGSDHLRQRFLRDLGYEPVRIAQLARPAELRHQEENSRQALLA